MTQQQLSLVHLVRRPTVATKGLPSLLLLLHGIGSNEQDLMALAPDLDGRFLVVSARAPIIMGPGSYGWYRTEFTPDRRVIDPNEPVSSRAALLRFVDELVETYEVDPHGVYLVGFSQGAIMAIGIAVMRPEWLAGVVAMSGRALPSLVDGPVAPEKLAGLPILVVHGTEDPVLPVENGRRIRDLLAPLPVDLTYREYRMGHQVSMESLRDVATWLSTRLDEKDSKA